MRLAQSKNAILAARNTANELSLGPWQSVEEEPGVHRIAGGVFPAYLLETDRIVLPEEPVLSMFSREFLRHPIRVAESLQAAHADMLKYVIQQVAQFRSSSAQFGVQRMSEKVNPAMDELRAWLLKDATIEERLQGIPAEERLRGIPPEERLRGIPTEQRLQGLSAQERAALRKLLDEEAAAQ